MRRRDAFATVAMLPWALPTRATAASPAYPSKPVRLVVGFAPGAQSDLTARMLGRFWAPLLGTQIVIENLPGASGVIGAEAVARAAPDGYTLLLGGTSNLAIAPAADERLRYDPVRNFVPIGRVARIPWAFAVRTDLPVSTVPELVRYVKSRPGQVTYAAGALAAQLAVEMLKTSAEIDVVQVPYKGTAPAVLEVAAGRVDFVAADVAALQPLVQAGRLRLIASTGTKRSKSLPDLATVAEQGITGYATDSWNAIVVPRNTPPDVVRTLRETLARALTSVEFHDGLERIGFEVIHEPPDALEQVLGAEIEAYRSLIRRTGMRIER